MNWWEGRMCGYDCETTHAEPETTRIVTAALVLVGGGQPTTTTTWLVNPGEPISPGATEVHGVTDEQAAAGRNRFEAVAEIVDALADCAASMPVCIFNSKFDLTCLDRESRRAGIAPLQDRVALRVVDAFCLDRHLDRYRRGSRKLDALCEHYGAGLDEAHDAGADALAACRLAYRIGQRGEIIRRVRNAQDGRDKAALVREWEACRGDLPALHAAQVRWAWEQAEGLRTYFEAKGQLDDAASVSGQWPLVRFEMAAVA